MYFVAAVVAAAVVAAAAAVSLHSSRTLCLKEAL